MAIPEIPKLIALRFVGKDSPVKSLLVDLVADIPNKLRRQRTRTSSPGTFTPIARKLMAVITINTAPKVMEANKEIFLPMLNNFLNAIIFLI